jgi:ribosomal protein S27E
MIMEKLPPGWLRLRCAGCERIVGSYDPSRAAQVAVTCKACEKK